MKKISLLLIVPAIIFAKSYMAKIEPFDAYTLYAQKAGQIVYLDKNDENKVLNKKIVQIDNKLDANQLKNYKEQLALYEEKLVIKKKNYEKFKSIRGKSVFDKDEKFIEVLDLQVIISNLKNSIAELEDSVSKKSISIKNLYLKEFSVNRLDYVTVGTKLAQLYDVSKSKLIVYVSKEELKKLSTQEIYIDGKPSNAKLMRKDITVDTQYMTSYKVEIESPLKEFGKIVSVEFK